VYCLQIVNLFDSGFKVNVLCAVLAIISVNNFTTLEVMMFGGKKHRMLALKQVSTCFGFY
jgi:hypothetical protein